LAIPAANLQRARAPGAVLGAAYELKVLNYTKADRGLVVYLPTGEAVFPATGGSIVVTIPAKNVTIAAKGWTSPALLAASKTLSTHFSPASSDAYLTTAKYAVMANATSGSVTLEFRWHWSITPKGGATSNGTWTVPSRSSTGAFLPSIFYPAPAVHLAGTSFVGTTMTLELNGTVANTSFRVVLEYPNNGTEIQSIWENSSVGSTKFNATLPVTYRDGASLPNGTYLVHIHDVCEAIVHMVSVTVSGGVPMAPVRPGTP
jgi:hypothetical protein